MIIKEQILEWTKRKQMRGKTGPEEGPERALDSVGLISPLLAPADDMEVQQKGLRRSS